jgi:hypothetical protein
MASLCPQPAVAMDGTAGVNLARMASLCPQPAVAMDGTAGVNLARMASLCHSARSGHGWHCGREYRAGEGTRTLDIQLGKLALYQLSYARIKRSIEFIPFVT